MKNSSPKLETSTLSPKKSKRGRKPKNSLSKKTPPKKCEVKLSEKENGGASKMNAFQFMMNSRHKSLGGNSPGKELDLNDSLENFEAKNDLKERRSKLEEWSEKKGAKRKREYEEIGKTIEYKLEVRGRRMKKMLQVESDDEVIVKRKRRSRVLSSDSENEGEGSKKLDIQSWKCKIKVNMEVRKSTKEVQENEDKGGMKRELRKRRSKPVYNDSPNSDGSEDEKSKKSKRKVAPVFLKSIPKPKLDPATVEARRQFLLSGVPASLRKEMEKQQSTEEIEFDVFPTISHIQQKTPNWELPKVILNLKSPDLEPIETKPITNLLSREIPEILTPLQPKKIKNCKKIIRDIKSRHPDYPVFKIFNSLVGKSGQEMKKKRGRSKNEKKVDRGALWTEKYKPSCAEDILGNHSAVSGLKKWLSYWLDGKTRKTNESESDFEVMDSDSRDSCRMVGNTVLVKGPTGSGKTAAIYAVCNELGFNVLEVNASSKRTGKRLMQELQEATQSHQVCKKESVLSTFISGKRVEEKTEVKKCVILIEDVDIIYEQDEGFISALSQIVLSSKRPVILTSTDDPSVNIYKLVQKTIRFSPLYSILTVWLQILCLVEGYYINQKSLDELLTYNKGDIRRTLLQLQLFASSGGSPDLNQVNDEISEVSIDGVVLEDDTCHLSEQGGGTADYQIHTKVLETTNPIRKLERQWWNFPHPSNDVLKDKENLRSLLRCYDAFSTADVMTRRGNFDSRWCHKTKDSIGLDEPLDSYRNLDFEDELHMTFLEGRMKLVKSEVKFNMALPTSSQLKWRCKLLGADEKLRDALLLKGETSKSPLSIDYLPFLRQMARHEHESMKTNSKRGNRFYSYLKSLGIRYNEANYKIICDVLKPAE